MNKHDKFEMEIGRTIILASHSLLNDRQVLLKKIAELEKACKDALVYIPEASVKFERGHYKVGQRLLTKAFRVIESAQKRKG